MPFAAGVPFLCKFTDTGKMLLVAACPLRIRLVDARMVARVLRSANELKILRPVVQGVMVDVVDVIAFRDFFSVVVVAPDFAVKVIDSALFVPNAGHEVFAVCGHWRIWVAAESDSFVGDGFGACHEVSACPF